MEQAVIFHDFTNLTDAQLVEPSLLVKLQESMMDRLVPAAKRSLLYVVTSLNGLTLRPDTEQYRILGTRCAQAVLAGVALKRTDWENLIIHRMVQLSRNIGEFNPDLQVTNERQTYQNPSWGFSQSFNQGWESVIKPD